MQSKKKYMNKTLLICLAVILILAAVAMVIHDFYPEIQILIHYTPANRAKLLTLVRSHGWQDLILFVIIVALMNAIPGLSNSVVCIFVGLCYGPVIGFLINWVGNMVGNFFVAAIINRLNFSKSFKRNTILNNLLQMKHPAIGLTIGYMVPVIPSVLVNYSAVKLHVPRSVFMGMIAVGMLPTSFLYAFGGDAILKGNFKRITAVVIAICILIALVVFFRRRRKYRLE